MNKTDKKIKMVKLGEVCKFVRNGKSIKQDKSGKGIPITRIETIWNWEIDQSRVGFSDINEGYESHLLQKGDVLLSHINSMEHIGKNAIYEGIPEKIIHGMNLLCLRPKANLMFPKYFLYSLRTPQFRKQLMRFVNKAVNQASVSGTNIKNLKIPLPPLAEQKRIAEILDLADEARRKCKKNLALYDDLIRSLFLKTFGDPVSNPMGYEFKALGKICDVRDGTHDSPKYVEKGYPLLTSKNLKDGYVDLSDINMISESDYEQINKRSKVDLGDILMPMIGTVGNPVLVEEKPEYAIKNMALIKFVPDSPDPLYVLHLLSSHYFDHATKASNRGGTQKFISLGNIRKLPIPIPDLGRQEAYIEQAEEINAQKVREKALYEQHDNLFNALLQRAFKGDLG